MEEKLVTLSERPDVKLPADMALKGTVLLKELKRANPFMEKTRMEYWRVRPGECIIRHEVGEDSANPYGMVHGGLLCSLADNATGCAASTDGRTWVTLNNEMNYISNVREGVIFCRARVRHAGRKIAVEDIEIFAGDPDGDEKEWKLLVTGSYTMYCVDK